MSSPVLPADYVNPKVAAKLKAIRSVMPNEHALFGALGVRPVLVDVGKLTLSVTASPDFRNADGDLHGGFYALLLDTALGFSVATALDELKSIATINLRTNFVATTRPGVRLLCAAECAPILGDVAQVSGRIALEETSATLATASGSFMVSQSMWSRETKL